VRDIFCFCCLISLAFREIKQLKREHIVTDMNGMQWIRKARRKTNNMCNIPLMSTAREIMDIYKDTHPYCQTYGVLFPVLSNWKVNVYQLPMMAHSLVEIVRGGHPREENTTQPFRGSLRVKGSRKTPANFYNII